MANDLVEWPVPPARLRYRSERHTKSRKALADKLRELRGQGPVGRFVAWHLLSACRAAVEQVMSEPSF